MAEKDHFPLIFLPFKKVGDQHPFLESFKPITSRGQFFLPRKAGPDSLSREEDKALLIRPWLTSTLPTSPLSNLPSPLLFGTIQHREEDFLYPVNPLGKSKLLVAPCDHGHSSHLSFSSLPYFSHFGHSGCIFVGRKTIAQGLRKCYNTLSDKSRTEKKELTRQC